MKPSICDREYRLQILFEKWDSALSLAKEGDVFAKCVVDRAKEVAAADEKCPGKESLLPMLEGLKVEELHVDTELKSRIEASVAKKEASMIGELSENISRWAAHREEEVLHVFFSFTTGWSMWSRTSFC